MAKSNGISRKRHNASERYSYLNQLLQEFNVTQNNDAKEQILANLANFAYNPINFEHLKRLNVINIFLNTLKDSNKKLKTFAIKGLCNLSSDSQNAKIIKDQNGIEKIVDCLFQTDDEIILATLTTFFNIQIKINRQDINERIQVLKKSRNSRIINLITILENEANASSFLVDV